MTALLNKWVANAYTNAFSARLQQPGQSSLSTRLAKGVFWSIVGAVISRGLGLASSVVVARLLGITIFGEFTIIQSTVGLFGTFAGLGLGITATKFVSELRESDAVRCGRIVGLILLVTLVGGMAASATLTLCADLFATRALAASKLAELLQYGAPLVLLGALQGVYTGALSGFEAFRSVARANWMGALLGAPALILCAWFGGLPGAVVGSILQAFIACVVCHVALWQEAALHHVRISFGLDSRDASILWRFSLPSFLSSIAVGPGNWICNTLLANQRGGYDEIALLNAAGQWKNLLGFLPLMIISVLLPMLSNLHQTGRIAEFRKLLLASLFLVVAPCLAMSIPIAGFAGPILGMYGHGFERGTMALILTVAGTSLVAVNNLLSRAMQASGRPWLDFSFSVLWGLVLVLSSMALVPSFKASGIAMANIIAAICLSVWQWLSIRKIFALPKQSRPANAPITAA